MHGMQMNTGPQMMAQPQMQPQPVLPPQQQLQQQQQQQQQPIEKLDNISKIKSLIGPLRESLSAVMRITAQALNQNCSIDMGGQKKITEEPTPRCDKSMEEFFALCDQIELEIENSIKCLEQSIDSSRYLPYPVIPTRVEALNIPDQGTLSYPMFLSTVNLQVSYIKALHDMLVAAAENISPSD